MRKKNRLNLQRRVKELFEKREGIIRALKQEIK